MQHELEERGFRELLKVNIGDLHDAKTMKALRQSRNDDRSMRDVDFMPCNFPGIQANADYSYAGQPEELASCKHMFLLRRNHVHRIFMISTIQAGIDFPDAPAGALPSQKFASSIVSDFSLPV